MSKVTNIVKLQHSDSNRLNLAVNGFNSHGILRTLLPIPVQLFVSPDDDNADTIGLNNKQQLGYSDVYDFCINEWGCTRDIDSTLLKAEIVDGIAVLEFDTTDTPPFEVYDKLLDLGFDIVAYYYQPIFGYCGIWDNGLDDPIYFTGYSSTVVRNLIDPTLDAMFGITKRITELEEF